ncbi:MAG: hypothetical protein RIB98_17305 [Acidimicrobiales bacterium]
MSIVALSLIAIIGLTAATVRGSSVSIEHLGALASDGPERELYERFFERSRRFRLSGAVVGWVVAIFAATVAADLGEEGSWHLDFTLVATIALAGSVIGSIAAETFRFRRPRAPRIASLEVRNPVDYDDKIALRREEFVAFGMVGALVLAAAVGANLLAVTLLAAAGVALALLRRWAVRRIALRPRPALSPVVAEADDDIRRMAASVGLGRPIVTLELLVLTWQLRIISNVEPIIGWFVIATLLVAFVWWRRNRSFGLTRTARREGLQPSAARAGAMAFAGIAVFVMVLIAARSIA